MSAVRRLVLIHGFTERPNMWEDMLTGWSDDTLVISTPSIPGHGNHPEIPVIRTAESYCEALLQQIPDDKLPLIVVGHSMGGYLASTLVRMVPDRIQALGFFHSKAGTDSSEKIEDRKRAKATAAQNKDLYLATMLRNRVSRGVSNTAFTAARMFAVISGLTPCPITIAKPISDSAANSSLEALM